MIRKPLSGAIWGMVLGIAIAIVLQQQGVWPPDKITVALVPGALGIIGIIITSVGRSGGATALTVSLIIAVPVAAYGATGLGEIGESGQLNGGCTAKATSAVDAISSPADTSRGRPFVIDPKEGLSWEATSGGMVFDDYPWEIWVEVAGVAIPIEGNESENNDAGDTENSGSVSNVEEYGESRGIPVSQLRGVFMVGGFASVCDGFGFVTLQAGLFETIISKVALAIAIIALIMLLRAALSGRGGGGSGMGGATPGTELEDIGGASASAAGAPFLAGDANLDGDVETEDFTSLGDTGPSDAFPRGDANLDGEVETDDITPFTDSGDDGYEPGSEDLPKPDDHA